MPITYFAGPGKLLFNGALLEAQQENGQILYQINQQKLDIAQAFHGRVGSQLGNTTGRITITPFDNWSALPSLFPPFLGATTVSGPGAGPGALAIGTRPHNPPFGAGPDVQAAIWNPAGNGVATLRTAIIRHPDLHLGVGKPLFGQIELSVLPSTAALANGIPNTWAPGHFHTVKDAGMADPGGQFTMADFVREAWVGVWGNVAGFGAIQAEDEWTISTNARYDEVKEQEQALFFKLASVEFMARCRPVGPLWTQIDAAVMNRGLGVRFGSPGAQGAEIDLVLTSTGSNRTITIENVDVVGAGYEFGGTRLATGEVGFVTQTPFQAGNPEAMILFSA